MIEKISVLIAAACVSAYWTTVAVKSILIARVIGKDPNVVPREKTGQFMRLFWLPIIGIWISMPWLYLRHVHAVDPLREVIAVCGAVVCALALAASYHCWHEMGTSWRIGIDPSEKTNLIVSGAYRYVRHPIYALSISMVWGTLAAAPSIPLLVIAILHTTLMRIEARREEKFMLRVHGQTYQDYLDKVGRFIPRI
jgi:protein-S-isoprenylcysteine O-methyltransferase Ste14